MEPSELFTHYLRHHATPQPRDMRYLEGMYVIRRAHDGSLVAGEIVKSAPSLQRFQIRPLSGENKSLEWIAYGALQTEVLLLHSSADLWACFTTLSRNAQEHARDEAAAQKGGAS